MIISRSVKEGRIVLEIQGDIRAENVHTLRKELDRLIEDGHLDIYLDMSKVSYIDSSGLGLLIEINRKLQPKGGSINIINISEGVLKLLRMTKLDQVLNVMREGVPEEEAESLEAVRKERYIGKLRRCWEYLQCGFEDCIHYGKDTFICWVTPHVPCKEVISDDILEEIAGCVKCKVFQNNVDSMAEIQQYFQKYIEEAEKLYIKLQKKNADLKKALSEKMMESYLTSVRYKVLIENATDMIFITNQTGQILEANKSAEKVTGIRKSEITNYMISDFIAPLEANEETTDLEVLRKGGEVRGERLLITSTGRELRVDLSVKPALVGGEVIYLFICRDITEKCRLEEEKESVLKNFIDTIENMTEGFAYLDESLTLKQWNRTAEKITGIKKADILGRNLEELAYAYGLRKLLKQCKKVLQTSKPQIIRECLHRTGGISGLFDYQIIKAGEGLAIFFKEVSEIKQLREKLLQAQKMEALGRLASGAAHDFNNILASVLGYTSLLKAQIGEDSPHYDHVKMIEKSVERASELTQQLISFAKGEKLRDEIINLNEIVEEVITLLKIGIKENIVVDTAIDPSLALIKGDPSQINQVLLNICVNAKDAMPQGGRLTVKTYNFTVKDDFIRTHPEVKMGKYAVVAISDTGIGMDKDTLPKIFDPFFTTKRGKEGTGLGLSLAYSIVKNHSGYILVDTQIGKGSTFYVFLPAIGKKRTSRNRKSPASGK